MRLRPCLALALLPLVVAAASCHRHGWEGESDLVVLNESNCTMTVSVDGWEATSVEPNQSRTVDNIGAGRHVLEVKDGAGRLIERRYIDLAGGEDYHWRIETCSPR